MRLYVNRDQPVRNARVCLRLTSLSHTHRPFCAFCLAVSFHVRLRSSASKLEPAWLARPQVMKKIKNAQKELPLDVLGSLLVGGGTVCIVLFTTWGGQDFGYAWNSVTWTQMSSKPKNLTALRRARLSA